jgi:triacylglycerol lipase
VSRFGSSVPGFFKARVSLAILLAALPLFAAAAENSEYVILLHGMWRTSRSMEPMAEALTKAGYKTVNVNYPSRTASIEKLSDLAIDRAVADCQKAGATKINFVTHSVGGLLVRSYLARHTIPQLGRVVMLGPPNQGSEVVDKLGSTWAFKIVEGPAGTEMGTGTNSTPSKLGRANFCLGIIAGDRSIDPINSLFLPGPNDGKVTVERTKLDGMADHIVIHSSHTFLMVKRTAIQQTLNFLRTGRFEHKPEVSAPPNQPSAGTPELEAKTQTGGRQDPPILISSPADKVSNATEN